MRGALQRMKQHIKLQEDTKGRYPMGIHENLTRKSQTTLIPGNICDFQQIRRLKQEDMNKNKQLYYINILSNNF